MTDPNPASTRPDAAAEALPDWLTGDARPYWRRPRNWLIGGLGLLALAGALTAWQGSRQAPPAQYLTEPLRRGDLALVISANGSLQPTRSVSLGSELSGTVARVLVDVNDRVSKGQVLVELDTSKLQDQISRSQAALQSAQAAVVQARATLQESGLGLARLEEVARLSGGKLPAANELDAAHASLARARAAEASAQAGVAEAQATLRTDQTNLDKARVRSPIDGVVLTRSVEPGNAVAASLQAVTLFTLAEDLSHLKLSVNVDEADVGQIQLGQSAEFSVSAWPDRKYPARITRVAYGSTTTDNVVTYTTQLEVANPDGSLRPGMTASASIAAAERHKVWLVPRSALSFNPQAARAGEAPRSAAGGAGILGMLMPRPPGAPSGAPRAAGIDSKRQGSSGRRSIWVLQDGQPRAIDVRLGLSNGPLTEVSGDDLRDGMAVITEQQGGAAR